jgi:hypothetical protein
MPTIGVNTYPEPTPLSVDGSKGVTWALFDEVAFDQLCQRGLEVGASAAGDLFQIGEGFGLLEVLEQHVVCWAATSDCCWIGWVWAFVLADPDAPADADDQVFCAHGAEVACRDTRPAADTVGDLFDGAGFGQIGQYGVADGLPPGRSRMYRSAASGLQRWQVEEEIASVHGSISDVVASRGLRREAAYEGTARTGRVWRWFPGAGRHDRVIGAGAEESGGRLSTRGSRTLSGPAAPSVG